MALLGLLISSISAYDLILILSTLLVVYTGYFYFSYFTRENPVPGPLPLPFVGNIIDRGFDDFVDYAERMRKKYGDMFEIYFGPSRFIMMSKFESMNNMFDYSTNSKYMKRIPYIFGLEELDIAGKGIALNHNVTVWKYNRHFLSRALLTPSFSKYAVTWAQKLTEEMIEFWRDGSNENGYFETDLVEWAHRFTTDSITHFTTGKRVYAMEALFKEILESRNMEPKRKSVNDTNEASKFFFGIKTLIVGIYFFIVVPSWIRKYIPFINSATNKHLKNRDWLFGNIDESIRQRRKEIEYTPRSEKLRFDMLTSMITANTDRDICEIKKYEEGHTEPMTDEQIRGVLWETYVGGIDTTANLFTFIVYYLAKYPNTLKRLREEIDAYFEKLGDKDMTLESLNDLVYTEAVIKEVFRLFTPAPYTARNSTAEDIVENQVFPEGTQYIINIHGINRNEKYWDQPDEFIPERWLDGAKTDKLSPYVVFGGGRRVCPGRKLSYIELKCLIPLIYRKMDVELVSDQPPKPRFILIRSYCDLNVRIKPRTA